MCFFNSLPAYSFLPSTVLLLQSGMYMLDSEYWDASFSRCLNVLRQVLIAVASAGAVVGIVFRVEDYSYGPICVFLVGGPCSVSTCAITTSILSYDAVAAPALYESHFVSFCASKLPCKP